MPGAVFSRIAHRLASHQGEIFPLHVGDTWMEPMDGARMEDLRVAEHPGLHRYTDPQGSPALIGAVVEKLRAVNGLAAERANVLIAAGATGALGAAVGMLAEPGEEVIVLSPFWPLIRGIVQAFRATPVEAPFYGRVRSASDAVEAIRPHISPRTVAIYVSTPSNPTGLVLPADQLAAIAELAREHDLWILSDEVYEEYVYEGEHCSIARFAPERTLSAFSFSKAYGMAGNRTGYLVGPAPALASCRKVSTHTFYSAPTSGQLAGLRALRDGGSWLAEARSRYREAGYHAADTLGLPRPQGSTFLFLDLSALMDQRGIFGFLEDALDDGLVLAPGPSFGQGFESFARICFTSAPPDRVAEAVRRLRARIGPAKGLT